jgi:hypothetical protein
VVGFRVRLRGTGPALAGKLEQGVAFALRARRWGDRFQSSLRPYPAAAGVAGGSEPSAGHRAILAFQAGIQDPQPTKIPGMDEGIPLAVFPNSEIVP